jgi:5-methylcytosine-specific restriction endonuclease McrA
MIRLTLTEPTTQEWKKWRTDAEAGHEALRAQLQQTGTFDVKESLYKRMKDELFHLYHSKCAYCESPLRLSSWDQLDHFRPKNKVLDEHNRMVWINRAGKPHTGYYWLAYEWTNLLPSCAVCNQRKGAIFPVLPGSVHAKQPGKESGEKPIFIHPIRDDPADHLEYVPTTGFLKSKTSRGRGCIDVLDLNREELVNERRAAYRACIELLSDLLDAVKRSAALPADELAKLKSILQGVAKYSLVGRSALKQCESALEEVFKVRQEGPGEFRKTAQRPRQ